MPTNRCWTKQCLHVHLRKTDLRKLEHAKKEAPIRPTLALHEFLGYILKYDSEINEFKLIEKLFALLHN
jgi:hypothetical protein